MKKLQLIIPALLLLANLTAQVTADFLMNINEGCDPLVVNFTDQSTGAVSWAWDFGDSNMSNEQNPIHTFTDALPTYNVCLTATDGNGNDDTTCKTVTVHSTPTADASATTSTFEITCLNPVISFPIILDGSNSSTGPNLVYEWFDQSGTLIKDSIVAGVDSLHNYILKVRDTLTGCEDMATFIYTVSQNIDAPVCIIEPPPILTCTVTEITLDANNSSIGANYTYVWTTLNGNILANANTMFPIVNEPGIYTLTVINTINGCTASLSVEVQQDVNPPVISITSNVISCTNDMIIIDGTPCLSCFIEVYDAFNNLICTSLPCTLDPINSPFTIVITDASTGCTSSESINIVLPPVINVTGNVTHASCVGNADGAIDLWTTGGTPPYFYTWSNGATSEDIINLAAGIYSVTVTDINGCIAEVTFQVNESPILDISNDTTICAGDAVQLFVSAQNAVSFTWAPSVGLSDPSIANPMAMPLQTTTYVVTVTDNNNCTGTAEVIVNVQDYLDFGLLQFSNSPLCEGDTIEFYANLGTSFQWTGPGGFSSTEENPTIPDATPSNSGIYTLEIEDQYSCTASATFDVFVDDDCVWAGDTDTNKVVNNFDLLNIGLAFDSTGFARPNASLAWVAQPAFDWVQSTPTTGVNFKHADTNGDGMVTSDDTLAIVENWGLMHDYNNTITINQFTDLPYSNDGNALTAPFYIEPDTLLEGETMSLEIILGDMTNQISNLYGIAFSIEYDTAVVVPGSAWINFDNCWLGDVNANAISIQKDFPVDGRIDAAITRIDGMEMTGFGIFGDLIITLEDDILLFDPKDEKEDEVFADFKITNFHLINFAQEEILVEAIPTTSPVGTTSTDLAFLEKNIRLFPNPTSEGFYISSDEILIENIRVFDIFGKIITTKTTTDSLVFVTTNHLSSGMYFVEIQTDRGILSKKVSIY